MAERKNKSAAETLKDKVVEPLMAAGETIKAQGQKAAANSAELTSRVIDHAEANTREAFAALRAAAQSTSLTDVLKVQGEFVQEQGKRSMAQAREIGEMIAKFGRESIEAIKGKDG